MHEPTAAVVTPSHHHDRVHRIEVRITPDVGDPRVEALLRASVDLPEAHRPQAISRADVYLLAGAFEPGHLEDIARALLADPGTQTAEHGATQAAQETATVEIHPLPGVTDPAAQSVQVAVQAMLGIEVQVRTGERFDLTGVDHDGALAFAGRLLANPVVQAIHQGPFHPDTFPAGHERPMEVREIPLRELDDAQLEVLSREAHLFLSLDEMRAIQAHYRDLRREPREIELETLAQTWSEHCVHKTLKATIDYRELPGGDGPSLISMSKDRVGHSSSGEGRVRIDNLLKSTVAQATFHLQGQEEEPFCLSVFVDNAGIVAFDDDHAVCMKVETHNHPSAIEPYGGAATGIGGCIRDIMGTGLAAKPIAATDVFCVATPHPAEVPSGCLHPRRVLSEVVAGVRDYGNRMGIPTLDGGVWFDDAYVGNPLVYCGCIGVMPRWAIEGDARPGDRIIAMGGRTGRDGIHGATFSSAELTDTHADEFSHAVQIGNPITEKTTLDAILEARDEPDGCLYSAITDCGAGGFSSAVGEMGEKLGAEVHLENAPLKYVGLSPTEIWISEAQERMVMAVPPENLERLTEICNDHGVEWCDLGVFGTPDRELILFHEGVEVGRLSMAFMHDGVPMPVREAVWDPEWARTEAGGRDPAVNLSSPKGFQGVTEALLSHPNLASKAWIVRQYDHEVQGGSVVKPFAGPHAGPSDAAVVRPVAGSSKALAIGNGLATGLARDPYLMGLAAIDECVRNIVCVGGDPGRMAILDNFCWPSCHDPRNLGSLVRAAEACLDGALAYRTPFISGKDSLSNQFSTEDGRTIRVPPTLLISGMAMVPNDSVAMTMDLKSAGSVLVLVGRTSDRLGGSHFLRIGGDVEVGCDALPTVDLQEGPRIAREVHQLICDGLVRAAHDPSEGGVLPAVAEMGFAGGLGVTLDLAAMTCAGAPSLEARAFAEDPARYLLEVDPAQLDSVRERLAGVPHAVIGSVDEGEDLVVKDGDRELERMSLASLRHAWQEAIAQ
ncbi:MAG: phosphoribosylformylglycinamidine synthase subunit PurS [Phycisphaerales bacterium]|nr:phosphoribosylformylglycinamidine synthase subunit PurS [Phycisphaerales bacterium]